MSKTAIITDSTTALPEETVRELNITIVRLNLIWDGVTYLDGIDIKPEEFYGRLMASSTIPSTSQPSVAAFEAVYRPLIADGYDILVLPISSKISGTYDSALQASKEFPADRAVVLDTLQASLPLAILAIIAARSAQKGASLLEVTNLVKDHAARLRTLFVVDTLEYLHKGGRIGTTAKLLGSALNLKPILELKEGTVVAVEKIRTQRKALTRVLELAEEDAGKQGSLEFIGVISSDNPALAEELLASARGRFHVHEVIRGILSPVIGTHAGPGTIGLVYLKSKK